MAAGKIRKIKYRFHGTGDFSAMIYYPRPEEQRNYVILDSPECTGEERWRRLNDLLRGDAYLEIDGQQINPQEFNDEIIRNCRGLFPDLAAFINFEVDNLNKFFSR